MQTEPAPTTSRKAIVLSERLPPDALRALAAAGLEVRLHGDPCAPDVLLADPRSVGAKDGGIENVIGARVCELLVRVGDSVPDLYSEVMGQTERGLFKAVLGHTQNHLGRASKILGLDRNTCARKARAFGLVTEPSRGRKPRRSSKASRPVRGGKRK